MDNEAANEKILKRVEKIEQNIVTKEDIKSLASKDDIEIVLQKITAGNAEVKFTMLQYTIGLMIALCGIMIGLNKFL